MSVCESYIELPLVICPVCIAGNFYFHYDAERGKRFAHSRTRCTQHTHTHANGNRCFDARDDWQQQMRQHNNNTKNDCKPL